MFLFYSVHYPYPDTEALLVQSMHILGEVMSKQPGFVFVAPYPFKDPEKGTLMGISMWTSREAFGAASITLQNVRDTRPADDWESKPTEVYMLDSAM